MLIQSRIVRAAIGGAVGMLLAAPCGIAQGAAAAGPVQASAGSGSQLASQILVFKQVKGLSLTPKELETVETSLAQLDAAQHALDAREDAAMRPVMAQLGRIHDALLNGQAVDPNDQAQVDAADAPLKSDRTRVAQLRSDAVANIRDALTPEQIAVVRIDVGMPSQAPRGANGQPGGPGFGGAGGGAPGGGAPGGGAPGGGAPGFGGAPGGAGAAGGASGGGQGFGQGGGTPGAGGGRPARSPEQFLGRMLDRLRSQPQDQYDQSKGRIAGFVARRSGLDPNSAEGAAAIQNVQAQMDQLRQMPDDQYQQNRGAIIGGIMQKMNINPNAQPGGPGGFGGGTGGFGGPGGFGGGPGGFGGGARQASNDEAVRRFFLRPEVLTYLKSRTAAR